MKTTWVFVVATTFFLQAQRTARATDWETIKGVTYERVDDRWYKRDAVSGERWEIAEGRVIVRFVPGATAPAIGEFAARNLLVDSLRSLAMPSVLAYQYPTSSDPIDVLKRILASTIVENAFLDTYLKPHSVPNDPYYDRQWNLRKIGLERAWDITGGDPSVTIAVIDWGAQYDHEDLASSTWHNPGEIVSNSVDDDHNGFVDDIVGWDFIGNDNDPRPEEVPGQNSEAHGVACAGIVGAVTNNGIGIAGISSGCKVVHIRVRTSLEGAWAVKYCWKTGIDVISMSWGADLDSIPVLSAQLDTAYALGAVLVASAGNAFGAPVFPASHPSVIAVGGIDSVDVRPPNLSNYGEIMAPTRVPTSSTELWTTDNEGSFQGVPYPDNNPGSGADCNCPAYNLKYYHKFGLTSAACPTVAGVAGLILSHEPTLTNVEVRERLRRGAVDICSPGVDEECGYGRVDAYRSLTKWGTIDENATWSGTVYVSGDVEVSDGATLTIAAGTTVFVATDDNEHAGNDSDRVEFNIEGRLVAIGTLASPIVFESWTPTSSDDWVGFYFDAESDGGKFTRCVIRDAEYAIESYAEIEVRSSTVENCGAGIVSYDGSAFVKGCTISSEHWGVFASGGDITVRDSAVSDPSASCLQIQNGSSLVARNSQFTDGGNGLVANTSAVVSVDSSCVFNANDVGVAVFNAPSLASIKRSTINSNTSYGIRCDTYSHPLIENNTLRYNSVAIYCTNSSSPTIKGNMIKTNTFGVSAATDANPNIGICCGSGNNTIAYSSQKHVANWNDFEIKAQNNCWNVNTGGCYPPASKILGLVDVDLPQCCSTMAGTSEAILEPEPENDDSRASAALVSVVPNPFNPSATIHYKLTRRERVSIAVYDVSGRIVRGLVDRDGEPGSHTVWWDGVDERGSAAASGVYFVRFSAGSVLRTMKIVLVK